MKTLFYILCLLLVCCSPEISQEITPSQINQLKNGKKEGYWILTYWNGRKKAEGNFKNGVEQGDWKVYSRDGKFYWQGKMENGYWVGWWYLTNSTNHIKIDALKYNKWGECIGHATMKW